MLKILQRIWICRSEFFCDADLVLIMFPREFEQVFRRRLILIIFPHEFESIFRRMLLIDTQGKWFEYNNVSKPFDAFMGFQLLNIHSLYSLKLEG